MTSTAAPVPLAQGLAERGLGIQVITRQTLPHCPTPGDALEDARINRQSATRASARIANNA
jgi:hypothetical protein